MGRIRLGPVRGADDGGAEVAGFEDDGTDVEGGQFDLEAFRVG